MNSSLTTAVQFENISRHYGEVRALDGVSFSIAEGEFFSMLGPSGSGKTTSLRIVAGFEQPSAGTLRLYGETANAIPPYRRDLNTVFQDYALFPHMNVLDNIAYGLKVKGVEKRRRQQEAEQALELVALAGFGQRRPGQLSGGQRQRVALARALVNKPRILLLDEPLGALDLKLREQMQTELKALQRQLGITFVYVTHDQGEALSMSDRIAVFNRGRIEQLATPSELYLQPQTPFVADFVGTSNVVRGALAERLTGKPQPFSIRPEHIRLGPAGEGAIAASGRLIDVQYKGASSRLEIAVDAAHVLALELAHGEARLPELPARESTVELHWPRAAMVFLREPPDRKP